MEELSFEEFQATERRARAKQQTTTADASKGKKPTVKKAAASVAEAEAALRRELAGTSTEGKTAPAAEAVKVTLRERLGTFLELSEMQAAVCFLLVLDSFSSLFQFSGVTEMLADNFILELWARGLASFSIFAIIFFLLEVLASFVAFGSAMFSHFGYLADIIIVVIQAHCEFNNLGRAYKLLNFFRFWRILRLFFSMVEGERASHEVTRQELVLVRREAQELREKIKLLEDDVEKEKEARGAVEEMLQNYKEEVDTLNEALKIAAMDIAEVAEADDDFFSDEEGEGEEEGSAAMTADDDAATAASSSIVASTAASSTRDRMAEELRENPERNPSKNREELYRLATTDATRGGQKSTTFVVHPDGTFEYK